MRVTRALQEPPPIAILLTDAEADDLREFVGGLAVNYITLFGSEKGPRFSKLIERLYEALDHFEEDE